MRVTSLVLVTSALTAGALAACGDDSSTSASPDGGHDASTTTADASVQTDGAANGDATTTDAGSSGDASDGASALVPASSISSFSTTTCFAKNGVVYCWGSGTAGQLGDGTNPTSSMAPRTVAWPQLTAVSVGTANACGLYDGGAVCWGRSAYGENGHDPTIDLDAGNTCGECNLSPVVAPGTAAAVRIGAGFLYACAIQSGGTVSCWGLNELGETGQPADDGGPVCSNNACALAPTIVPGVSNAIQLALSSDTTCALKGDGTVWCWGANYTGMLGVATVADAGAGSAPVDTDPHPVTQVPGIDDAVAIAAGPGGHACAIRAGGNVWCWGRGGFGQTGHARSADQTCPYGNLCTVSPAQVPGVTGARELALGGLHSCAITTTDAVYCWGQNFSGQLGHDPAQDQQDGGGVYAPVPMLVTLPPAAHLAAGAEHTCAALKDGTVRCWGDNGNSQLGIDGGSTFVPTEVFGL